jgi:hypothetical protein
MIEFSDHLAVEIAVRHREEHSGAPGAHPSPGSQQARRATSAKVDDQSISSPPINAGTAGGKLSQTARRMMRIHDRMYASVENDDRLPSHVSACGSNLAARSPGSRAAEPRAGCSRSPCRPSARLARMNWQCKPAALFAVLGDDQGAGTNRRDASP